MSTFAQRLKFARKRCGINQQELAELSGINQSLISRMERGVIEKTAGVVALAVALDCHPRWLETGIDVPGEKDGQPQT